MNQNFTLVFTPNELDVIFSALQEMPYKKAAPIIETINQQIRAAYEEQQRKAQEEAKTTEKEEKK